MFLHNETGGTLPFFVMAVKICFEGNSKRRDEKMGRNTQFCFEEILQRTFTRTCTRTLRDKQFKSI